MRKHGLAYIATGKAGCARASSERAERHRTGKLNKGDIPAMVRSSEAHREPSPITLARFSIQEAAE
jgi:hypothetical protein